MGSPLAAPTAPPTTAPSALPMPGCSPSSVGTASTCCCDAPGASTVMSPRVIPIDSRCATARSASSRERKMPATVFIGSPFRVLVKQSGFITRLRCRARRPPPPARRRWHVPRSEGSADSPAAIDEAHTSARTSPPSTNREWLLVRSCLLRLEQPDHGLCQRVVVRVTRTADRRLRPDAARRRARGRHGEAHHHRSSRSRSRLHLPCGAPPVGAANAGSMSTSPTTARSGYSKTEDRHEDLVFLDLVQRRLLSGVDGVGGNDQHPGVRWVNRERDGTTPGAQRSRVIRL
jgi:hypothetical protein